MKILIGNKKDFILTLIPYIVFYIFMFSVAIWLGLMFIVINLLYCSIIYACRLESKNNFDLTKCIVISLPPKQIVDIDILNNKKVMLSSKCKYLTLSYTIFGLNYRPIDLIDYDIIKQIRNKYNILLNAYNDGYLSFNVADNKLADKMMLQLLKIYNSKGIKEQ